MCICVFVHKFRSIGFRPLLLTHDSSSNFAKAETDRQTQLVATVANRLPFVRNSNSDSNTVYSSPAGPIEPPLAPVLQGRYPTRRCLLPVGCRKQVRVVQIEMSCFSDTAQSSQRHKVVDKFS